MTDKPTDEFLKGYKQALLNSAPPGVREVISQMSDYEAYRISLNASADADAILLAAKEMKNYAR